MKVNVLLRAVDSEFFEPLRHKPWIGVDYGAYYLINEGVRPIHAFGDFDSVTDTELAVIQSHMDVDIVPSEKDFTDFELSLRHIIDEGYSDIDVYGALGGRMDHTLANIQTLVHADFVSQNIRLIDNMNIIRSVDKGTHHLEKTESMTYVSIIPMFPNTRLSLKGFRYEIEGAALEIGKTLTVSNEFAEGLTATIETSAPIIIVESKDK